MTGAEPVDEARFEPAGAPGVFRTKFTEFVTECKVLDDARMAERVVLCEATGVVMRACFDLLGIEYLMQI